MTNVTEDALEEGIEFILTNADHSWFTEELCGGGLKRFVVAVTDNQSWTVPLLIEQAKRTMILFWQATIGWWTSPEGTVVVDIGISTDDLAAAKWIGKAYNQKAVRDSIEKKEIRL